jgi:CHAT domain-containing protein/tetratricopeptide (TPR) repeat protein
MNRALLHRSGRWSGPLFISLAIALDLSQAGATAQEITRPGRPPTQLTEDERILQLQERDRHRNEAVRLANSGRLDEAVREMEATLVIERQVLGELSDDAAKTLLALAKLHEFREDRDSARKVLRDLLALRELQSNRRDWRVGDARRDLADLDKRTMMTPRERKRLEMARQLHSKGQALRSRQQYTAAEVAMRDAIQTFVALLGEDHPYHAAALNNLGGLYEDMGAYARAEPLYLKALAIWKNTVEEDHPDYARSLNNLGGLYRATGQFAQAEPLYRRALAIKKQSLGEDHPDYARSLNNLGELYRATGEYARAEPLYRHALMIRKRSLGEDHPDYAEGMNNLGMLYQAMGEYVRAEKLLRQALKNLKQAVGEVHPAYACSLSNLGGLYQDIGDYTRAEPIVRRSLEIRKKVFGEDHPAYATGLNNMADLHVAKGDYALAKPLFHQALAITKKAVGGDHPDCATSLCNLGTLYLVTGEQTIAEPLLRRALEIWKQAVGEDHPTYASGLNNLGVLYQEMGDYARAEPLYRRASAIRKQALGEDHPDYASSLTILGSLYQAMGDFARAELCLREALERQTARFHDTASALSERQTLELVGTMNVYLNGYLSVALQTGVRPDALYRWVLDWKGVFGAKLADDPPVGDRPELRPVLEELASIRSRLARLAFTTPGPTRRDAWREQLDRLRERKDDLESELARKSSTYRVRRESARAGPGDVAAALPVGTALVDLMMYWHYGPRQGGKVEVMRERRLLAFIVQRDRPVVCIALGDEQRITSAFRAWGAALVGHDSKVVQESATVLGQLVWEPLQPHLAGARTVLLAPDGLLSVFPFATLPGRMHGSYLIEDVAIGYVGSGREAAALLTAPQNTTSGGFLAAGAIDFTADPGPAGALPPGQHPLVVAARERGGFAPLPGTRAECELARGLFRRAFPDQPAVFLTGDEPTEAELKKRLDGGQWRAVHLGTHGFFSSPTRVAALRAAVRREQPFNGASRSGNAADDAAAFALTPFLRSGVILAGGGRGPDPMQLNELSAAPPAEDGILSAEEVQSLDLRGTELVVLSACETGLGVGHYGQGVLGLQRAFHAAGARAVVASLWKVDDAATSVLMEQFYTNLWSKKMPKLEALRQAQLAVLNDRGLVKARRAELAKHRGIDEKPEKLPNGGRVAPANDRVTRSDPTLWAAFILSGDVQ